MKYQKKYSTASDYQSDTHETNSVSMVSTDTLYYDGTAIQTNTGSGGNIIVEEDGLYQIKDGEIYPVSHPDLSTQPSLLPYRVGKKPVYQVMIPSSELLEVGSSGIRFSLPSNCEQVIDVIGYNCSNNTSGQYYGQISSDNKLWWTSQYHTSGQQADFLIVTYIGISDNYYEYEYSGSSGPTITRSWSIIGLPADRCTMANMYVPSNANPNLGDTIGSMIVSDNDIVTTYPIICNYVGSAVGGTVASLNIECHFIRHIGETDTNSTLINNGSSMNTATVTVNLYI